MVDVAIRNGQDLHTRVRHRQRVQRLQHSGAEATGLLVLFQCDDGAVARGVTAEQLDIDGLGKARINHTDANALALEPLRGFQRLVDQRTKGPHHHLAALEQHFGLAGCHLAAFALVDALDSRCFVAREAHGKGTIVPQAQLEHALHITRIARRRNRHVRQGAQVRDVEHTVVCGPIRTDQASAVQSQHHRQVLQRHFLEHLVVAALQEGRVDGCDRAQATLRHARGHGDRVLFRDAGVVEARRNARLVGVEPSA